MQTKREPIKFTGCRTDAGIVMPDGPIELISFGELENEIPELANRSFYLHKSIIDVPYFGIFTITDAETGFTVSKGNTRNDAIDVALSRIKNGGREGFLKVMLKAKERIENAKSSERINN